MNRRTPQDIQDFNTAVSKALGNTKGGNTMNGIFASVGGSKVHVRRALLANEAVCLGSTRANEAVCLGSTRAARWYSAKSIAKYGEEACQLAGDKAAAASKAAVAA